MKFLTYGSQALMTFPDGRAADVELDPLEHPRPGPDTGFRLPEIAEMIDGLLGHDPCHGRRQGVQEPGERLLQREPDGVAVEGFDLLELFEDGPIGITLDREEALVGVFDVVRSQLTPVHRGLAVPADASSQLEDVGRVARLRPRLGEVALHWKCPGRHAGTGLVLQKTAVGEREVDLRPPVDRQVRVEAAGIGEGTDSKDATTLRRLALSALGTREPERGSGHDGADCLQRVSATHVGGGGAAGHRTPPCAASGTTWGDGIPRRLTLSRRACRELVTPCH